MTEIPRPPAFECDQVVGVRCIDCATAQEELEADVADALWVYRTGPDGRVYRRLREGGDS